MVTLSLYSFSISSSTIVRAGSFNKKFVNATMYLFQLFLKMISKITPFALIMCNLHNEDLQN